MAELSRYLFLVGALPFVVLGLAHALATPRTPAESKGLSPRDPALRQAMSNPWLRTRAEAAILEARGDVDAASGKLDHYDNTILSLPLVSEALRDMLLRVVRRWKSEL